MGMSAVQSSAFKAASGEMDISALHLLSLGLLLPCFFSGRPRALLDVWAGWSNEKVRSAMLGRFLSGWLSCWFSVSGCLPAEVSCYLNHDYEDFVFMKWCFRFLKRLVSLPHTMLLRLWQTVFSVCLLLWMSMQPAPADLPQMEPPSSGGGSGLFGQIKRLFPGWCGAGRSDYLRHWVYCRCECRNFHVCGNPGWKKTRTQFGAIVVVGVILLVAVIWLLTKSASIIL